MRILVCNWKDRAHPAAGGAEVYVDAISRCWARWGNDVTLICAKGPGQGLEDRVDGVRVIRRGGRLSVYHEVRRWYRSEGRGHFDVVLDVVNTRPFLTPSYIDDASVVALIFQVAREVWHYETPIVIAMLGRYWLEPRWLRLYATVPVLTISESSRSSIESYGIRNITVVPVGLESPLVSTERRVERLPTVAFVGRLAANKRPDHALRAFQLARRGVPDAQMWVIGTGPMEAALRRKFAGESVRFFGRVSDERKLDLLSRSHAVLVSSVREGWGLVVTEAASVGTPSIGYDVDGLRDSLRASNGLVVKPNVKNLAATVAAVLPEWAAGHRPPVAPGGVFPWSEVARQVLSQLEEVRRRASG